MEAGHFADDTFRIKSIETVINCGLKCVSLITDKTKPTLFYAKKEYI